MRQDNKTRVRLPILKNLVDNILGQLQFLSKHKPNFHKTTYDVLQEIYDSLNQSTDIVKQLMGSNISDDCKSDTTSSTDISDILKRLEAIEGNMQSPKPNPSHQYTKSNDTIHDYANIEATATNSTDVTNVKSSINISINDLKGKQGAEFYKQFKQTFFNMRHAAVKSNSFGKASFVEKSTGYRELDNFIDMFDRWYMSRVDQAHNKSKGWKPLYVSKSQISDALYAFVVMYGYHVETFTANNFIDGIDAWLSDLDNKQEDAEKYLHPMPIKQFLNDFSDEEKSEYYTVTAIALWDLLMEKGLSNLCKRYGIYEDGVSRDTLIEQYKLYAPDILECYSEISINDIDLERIDCN